MENKKSFGQHYLVEYIGCAEEKLKFVQDIKDILLDAAKISEATVLEHYFKQFEPFGVTGIILIAESHFSIHTWPEDSYAAFDILTCGQMYPQKAIDLISEKLEAKTTKVQIVDRGF